MSRFRSSWPWWRWCLTGLSALALGLTALLGWHQLAGGPVAGCGGGSPCDQVLDSRWSSVAGVLPVSGLAAGVYLAMLVGGLFIGPATEAPVRRVAWRAMLVLTGAIAGGAVWFIAVQTWIIGAFCPYCMATHVTGLLLAAVTVWQAPRQLDVELTESVQDLIPAAPRRVIGLLPGLGLVSAGLASAGILAACQVAFPPKFVVRGGDARDKRSALDPHAIPLVGSPDAAFVVKLLFDYKCPHCRRLHLMLDEAVRLYRGKLAFALCPTPLNRQCNPYIPREVDAFENSCELAKIGLAVWVADREAFPAFDRWMFSFESGELWHPRSLDAARAKAVELIGRPELDAALTDPWVDQYLQTSVRIYGDATQGGNAAVPKLVFGSRWVTPELYEAGDLISVLQKNLAIPKP